MLPRLRDLDLEDGHLQKQVHKVLETEAAVELVKCIKLVLEAKLGRMLLGELPLGIAGACVSFFAGPLKACPLWFVTPVFRLSPDGFAALFGNHTVTCWLCRCVDGDGFEHLASCEVVAEWASFRFGSRRGALAPPNVAGLLGIALPAAGDAALFLLCGRLGSWPSMAKFPNLICTLSGIGFGLRPHATNVFSKLPCGFLGNRCSLGLS